MRSGRPTLSPRSVVPRYPHPLTGFIVSLLSGDGLYSILEELSGLRSPSPALTVSATAWDMVPNGKGWSDTEVKALS